MLADSWRGQGRARMNYRHIYHAGNFADVLKHIVLVLCLDYLLQKDGALRAIDAHAGAGLYSLDSGEAQKTREWESGIGSLAGAAGAPADLKLYLDAVTGDLAARHYPGSPLLIARRLRGQDRLIAAELHEPTFEALQTALTPYRHARTMHRDAYECIRAHIPPKERRGLVLADPPFELKDEFQTLARQMREWKKRWATGVYILWYPIKAHLPVAQLKEAAQTLGLRRTWVVEALVQERERPDGLNGCGLIVFNAPYTVPERVEALLPFLKSAMRLHETAAEWIVRGA
ncbi:MAG: 23S rRNA (adenine(2030)-N(6))-methyltransferase RlmJ [Rhodomicrobium sp.]